MWPRGSICSGVGQDRQVQEMKRGRKHVQDVSTYVTTIGALFLFNRTRITECTWSRIDFFLAKNFEVVYLHGRFAD